MPFGYDFYGNPTDKNGNPVESESVMNSLPSLNPFAAKTNGAPVETETTKPEVDENGNPVEKKGALGIFGGKRRVKKSKKMRGGAFRPLMAASLASTASPFRGGRRRKTRRTRRAKKGSKRHSRRR